MDAAESETSEGVGVAGGGATPADTTSVCAPGGDRTDAGKCKHHFQKERERPFSIHSVSLRLLLAQK